MEKLKFKTFTWPINPTEYTVESRRLPRYSEEDVFTGLGPVLKTIQGSGVFTGAGAYGSFQALAALMDSATAGALVHPVWGTCQAFLTELTLTQEPRENFVAYRFTFRPADASGHIPK